MEKLPIRESESHFVFPTFKDENGEIERVQNHFKINSHDFAASFLEQASHSSLTELTEDIWGELENSDSFNIEKGEWDTVAKHSESQEKPRDWKDLRAKLEKGTPIDAPVIAKRGNVLHLASGNTRLMVARALGIEPRVLIVDISQM